MISDGANSKTSQAIMEGHSKRKATSDIGYSNKAHAISESAALFETATSRKGDTPRRSRRSTTHRDIRRLRKLYFNQQEALGNIFSSYVSFGVKSIFLRYLYRIICLHVHICNS